MMAHLSFSETPLNLALHYLDVWQELRSNYIIIFKKASASDERDHAQERHPLFDWDRLPGSALYRAAC